MAEQSLPSRSLLRAFVLSILGVLLVWQVITRSFVAYLASVAPETALTLAPSNPEALLNLVEKHLTGRLESARRAPVSPPPGEPGSIASAPNPGDAVPGWTQMGARAKGSDQHASEPGAATGNPPASPLHSDEQLREWTELALYRDPLNARALRILGQLAALAGDEARTDKFMEAAASRSLHEKLPIYYMMQRRLQQKDYAAAVYYADALLRTTPQALPDVMPTLAFISATPAAAGELKAVLAKNPPWRASFLAALPNAASDLRTPLELLLAIKDAPVPPTTDDLRTYLNFLVAKKQHELAYYAWLQFLPAEQLASVGLLYNGSFELPLSGSPFDWVIASGAGVTTEILRRPDTDGRALSIRFEQGRVEFHGVTQLLMLAPGAYQFKGAFKGELIGRRGLKWRISCAGGAGPLAESGMLMGVNPTWKDIEFSFTVPSEDCRAQQLRLDLDARMSSEQLVTGAMWFDELKIARLAAAPTTK